MNAPVVWGVVVALGVCSSVAALHIRWHVFTGRGVTQVPSTGRGGSILALDLCPEASEGKREEKKKRIFMLLSVTHRVFERLAASLQAPFQEI